MPYIIKDENGETMRLVRRHEEAKQIISVREGWTMHQVKIVKRDGYSEALILGEAHI